MLVKTIELEGRETQYLRIRKRFAIRISWLTAYSWFILNRLWETGGCLG